MGPRAGRVGSGKFWSVPLLAPPPVFPDAGPPSMPADRRLSGLRGASPVAGPAVMRNDGSAERR